MRADEFVPLAETRIFNMDNVDIYYKKGMYGPSYKISKNIPKSKLNVLVRAILKKYPHVKKHELQFVDADQPYGQRITENSEDFEGLKIRFSQDNDGVAVRALSGDGNRELGMAELFFDDQGRLDPQTLWVDERYYGQGIAKAMYDFLKNRGYTVIRSWDQTPAGKGFWDKHRGAEANVWEQGVAEATGDERFDTMMGRMQKEPQIPDPQMPPTDVRDLYQWAVANNKPYHKIFANWANREGFKSVAPALQKAGNLDSDALDYWTPDVWEMWYGSKMPKHWSKERIPDELRDYLETVFDAYDNIVFDWPTEYRQIGQQGVAENFADGKGPGRPGDSVRHGIPKGASITWLEKNKHAKGRKGELIRWQLNMRRGHKK